MRNETILSVVCDELNVNPETVMKLSFTPAAKKGRVVWARQLCLYFAREYHNGSLNEIGKVYGRDHATVLHSCKVVHNEIQTCKERLAEFKSIENKLSLIAKNETNKAELVYADYLVGYDDPSPDRLAFQIPR